MKFVLDASMALAWIFERKNIEEAKCADRALLEVIDTETCVPALWLQKL